MAAYIGQEGFVLSRVLVDQSSMHAVAFTELIVALQHGEATQGITSWC